MYYVGFANSRFEHWREGFRTYTEAWITYQTARELRNPNRIALSFPGFEEP